MHHGSGTLINAFGETYVGQFEDGKKHGWGSFIYPNGDKYTGLYEEDERVRGKGTFSVKGGMKLEARENPLA